MVITSGQTSCTDASQTITLAGNGTTYIVEAGGIVDLIAGQNILFMPGSRAQTGCQVHGYIAQTCDYCPVQQRSFITLGTSDTNPAEIPGNHLYLKVYPNPTSGLITLELERNSINPTAGIQIYNALGGLILQENFMITNRHTISLSDEMPGLYILVVRYGDRVEKVKVILW